MVAAFASLWIKAVASMRSAFWAQVRKLLSRRCDRLKPNLRLTHQLRATRMVARAVRHFDLTKSVELHLCPADARLSAKFEHATAKIIAHALTIS